MDDLSRKIMEPDMQLAAAVQKALLNGGVPTCQCGKMVLKNRMSVQVGGDFYHFRDLGQDQVAFAIGDVEGHGIGSALVMSLILGTLRANVQDSRRPSRMVEQVNDLLVKLGSQMDQYITCSLIYGVVDLPSGVLLYVNAGHPYPIVCNRGTEDCQELRPTTMLLGVQQGVLPESCHQFQQNDRVVLFTDGIPDAINADIEPFGDERLKQIISEAKNDSPEELTKRVFTAVDAHADTSQPTDDQTLVVIDFDLVTDGI
jgi:phosphoserine phosphatase RsbU/P